VTTRIRMDSATGTVSKGGLWTEENLPSESVLYQVVTTTRSRRPRSGAREADDLMKRLSETLSSQTHLQLGGNRNVGRGLLALQIIDTEGLNEHQSN